MMHENNTGKFIPYHVRLYESENDIFPELLQHDALSEFITPNSSICNNKYTGGKYINFKINSSDVVNANAGSYSANISIIFKASVN